MTRAVDSRQLRVETGADVRSRVGIPQLSTLNSQRSRGFTFIELMVVIAIVALMLSFTMLRIDGVIPGERLGAAARQLGSNVGFVRSKAVATGQAYAVRYDLAKHRYMVLSPPSPEDVEAGVHRPTDLVPTLWERLPDGVIIADVQLGQRTRTEGQVQVAFTPLGTCTPHAIRLRLAEENDTAREQRWMTVMVNPLTGLVDILPENAKLDLFADEADFGGGLSGGGF